MSDLRQCSRTFLGEFIELYRSFPCLWQVKSAEYSDRNKKNQAYEILIEKFKEIDASANKETVTKKLILYVHGTGEDDIYKPSLWYFDKLEFLNDPEKVRPSTSTIDDETSQDTGQERESFDGESDVDLPTAPSTPAPSTSSNLTESVNLNTTYSRTPNRKRKVPRAEDKTDAVMMKIDLENTWLIDFEQLQATK
ncbi:hypothetical protein NQ318_022065 [Aromia moschata]|uniref:MADF domain-containing protein n=1 Tax=Aromia moschata TaxID=1265417 RepID=A0AAV8Z797_9CUCU|nr:hypothetical protein NQ318_022065 [Aromia moschata]